MAEIQAPKLILTLTIVFISGILIFTVIFRALDAFQELKLIQMDDPETKSSIETLKIIPWVLGVLYVTLVSAIMYIMLKKGREEQKTQAERKKY